MPNPRLKAICTGCRFRAEGGYLSVLTRADKHSDDKGHDIFVWEIKPNGDTLRFHCRILPIRAQSW